MDGSAGPESGIEVVEREATRSTDDVNPSRMTHVSFLSMPYKALCGAPLLGIRRPDDEAPDCHVCVELERRLLAQ